jgi:hypothetical protein
VRPRWTWLASGSGGRWSAGSRSRLGPSLDSRAMSISSSPSLTTGAQNRPSTLFSGAATTSTPWWSRRPESAVVGLDRYLTV